MLELTTVGWDAVVDNVVVLGIALTVWAEAGTQLRETVAMGKERGAGLSMCVLAVGPGSHFPPTQEGALFPNPVPNEETEVLERERPARL